MASVITIAFEGWKAQEAATGKPVLLNEFVFANVPNLDPTKPIDRNEKLPPANQIVHRQAVNKAGLVSENAVAYSVTLGADVGDFDFNWIGLLNKESGTVAMITHAPLQKKLKTQNGQQGNVLIRSFLLEFNGAAEETQIKTSAETWQIDFTARLTGMDEMQRLINVDNYGAAAFFNDGFEVTRSGEQFTVKKGLGYVGGLRGQLEQNQILNGLRNTKIYADFSYQGNIVSKWNTVIKITAAATLSNYVDAAGFTHQVFAIASIDASGSVKDLRPKGALSSQSISELEKRVNDSLGGKQDKGDYALRGESYTKTESNLKFQPAGNYAPSGDYATNTALKNGLALKFDKTGGKLSGAITASWSVKATTGDDESNSVEFNFVQKTPILRITKDGSPFDLYLPSQAGRLMRVDEYGIGGTSSSKDANTIESTEFTASDSDSLNFFATFAPALSMKRPGGSDGTGFITQIQGDAKTRIAFRQRERGGWRGWYEFYTEANTSKDANGFLRQGSATALITNNVVQNTGTSTANVISQKAVTDAIAGIKTLGDGQRWNDVKSQRQSGVAYTNSTGRTIALSVSTVGAQASSSVSIYVDNVLCSYNLFGGNSNADFTRHSIGYAIIPAGSTYRVDASSINTWAELR